ncbi:Wzz/FepE/Etk N-terminal domain-containing protein [Vibrio penaeicida]|uniref:LPS O-antigen chain length determinant protein WzzB n=1 Tax=Vibrio penaeicida TaxID=104609 RepID=UPI0027332F86|nr:Wzz/FepE/Etk N-terminal domain-containing protein [Vibrio penaeicida]MDP2575036.1 Wzz/FepE/Etk N-terminal domain-containing protein [Vibrio penaeicida]
MHNSIMSEQNTQMTNNYQQNDEIDLRELCQSIWAGKWVVLISTACFAVIALMYALFAQEWWTSKAKVALPQLYNLAEYEKQVSQFQPIFDIYQEDGTVLVSEKLDSLRDPEILFAQFIQAFNSSNNKKLFFSSNPEFVNYLKQYDEVKDKEYLERFYLQWFENISAVKESKKDDEYIYDLSFTAKTQENSALNLRDYVQFIKRRTHESALRNLQSIVEAKQDELNLQKRILVAQAESRLEIEIESAEYALRMASAANVTSPIQTNSDKERFHINLGVNALKEKVEVLRSIKNLGVIEPRLQQVQAKLDLLGKLKISNDIQFDNFRLLDDITKPNSRDEPKRTLIVLLGIILGLFVGIGIILVRMAFKQQP